MISAMLLMPLLSLLGSIQANPHSLSTTECEAIVRKFTGFPANKVKFARYGIYSDQFPIQMVEIDVFETDGKSLFCVDPKDGVIRTMVLSRKLKPVTKNNRISRQTARNIAIDFVVRNVPRLIPSEWTVLAPRGYDAGERYSFEFRKILNSSGALHPSFLLVELNSETGEVDNFANTPMYIIPTPPAPLVSRQKAIASASRYQMWNSKSHPFEFVTLNAYMNKEGIVNSEWHLMQYFVDPENAEGFDTHWVIVNAFDARIIDLPARIGAPTKRVYPQFVCQPHINLGETNPLRFGTSASMFVKNDSLYIRAEWLRKFGATVEIGDTLRSVSWRGKTINGTQLHPQRGYGGWYIPLRTVSSAFGWRLNWNAAKLEAGVIIPQPLLESP